MNDTFSVGEADRFEHLDGDVDRSVHRQPSSLFDQSGECLALNIFEHQPRCIVLQAGVIQRHDVRVGELAHDEGFVQQGLDAGAVVASRPRLQPQSLDGDAPLELGVLGEVDLPLGASAQSTHDLETADTGGLWLAGHAPITAEMGGP